MYLYICYILYITVRYILLHSFDLHYSALLIRLAGGSIFPFSGRVEIYRNGVWGTVCDKNWTYSNAQVVCRQLGYKHSLGVTDLNVAAGNGPILMEKINCSGDEANLLACSHNGFGNHNCGHVEDVGVTCLPLYSGKLNHMLLASYF